MYFSYYIPSPWQIPQHSPGGKYGFSQNTSGHSTKLHAKIVNGDVNATVKWSEQNSLYYFIKRYTYINQFVTFSATLTRLVNMLCHLYSSTISNRLMMITNFCLMII